MKRKKCVLCFTFALLLWFHTPIPWAFAQAPATTTAPAPSPQPPIVIQAPAPPPPPQPTIVGVTPSSAPQGTTETVEIFGNNTNFAPDSTVTFSGEGITVVRTRPDVINIGHIIVTITIKPDAPLGPRDVIVSSPLVGNKVETIKGTGLFTVTTGFLFFGVSPAKISTPNVSRPPVEDPASFTVGDIFQIMVTIINSKPKEEAIVDAYLLLIDPRNRMFFLSPDLTKFIQALTLADIQPLARGILLPTKIDPATGRPIPIVKDLTIFRDAIKPNTGLANLGFGFFKLLSGFTKAGTSLAIIDPSPIIGIPGSAVFSVTEPPKPPIITITSLSVRPDDIPSGGNASVIVTISQPLNGVVVRFSSSAGAIDTTATTTNGIAVSSFSAPSVTRPLPLSVEITATVENSTARKVVKVFRRRL